MIRSFGFGKAKAKRVPVPPLPHRPRLPAAGERIVHIAEDESPAVPGDPVGAPGPDLGGDGRAPAVGTDHDRGPCLAQLAVGIRVGDADRAAVLPEDSLHRAALAHLGAPLAGVGDQLDVEQVARDRGAEVEPGDRLPALPSLGPVAERQLHSIEACRPDPVTHPGPGSDPLELGHARREHRVGGERVRGKRARDRARARGARPRRAPPPRPIRRSGRRRRRHRSARGSWRVASRCRSSPVAARDRDPDHPGAS